MNDEKIINAMTIDVEDYFQVSAFESYINKNNWDSLPQRVEKNTNLILDMLAEHNVKATFFTLGWVAERFPELIKRIVNEGHELACHSYDRMRVTQQTPEQFRKDIVKTKKLEGIGRVLYDISRSSIYSLFRTLWKYPI